MAVDLEQKCFALKKLLGLPAGPAGSSTFVGQAVVQLQVRVRDVARYRLIPRATADAETRDGGARRAREPGGTFRER